MRTLPEPSAMNASERYLLEAARLLDRLRETQAGAIGRAVRAVAGALGGGGTLYAFGTGHSHLLAEELFYRAGGLVRVHPILDNGGVPGDAAIGIGPYRCGPTSTVAGAALLQAVVCGVVEALVAEGREPEVFRSANEDGGDEANEAFLRKYRASIPML